MEPVVGMIVPPAEGKVPPEAEGLFPTGVRFAARGLGLKAMTLEDYGSVIDRVAELSLALRDEENAQAISLMGTSLSFFRGTAFNEELVRVMHEATDLPATTMSNAIRDGLGLLGARRIAIGAAYTDEVNAELVRFLEDSGFEVLSILGLGVKGVAEITSVTESQVVDLGQRAAEAAHFMADAVLISCGGLPALNLAPILEAKIGLPVVASATAGVWASVRLVGLTGEHPALGKLGALSSNLSLKEST